MLRVAMYMHINRTRVPREIAVAGATWSFRPSATAGPTGAVAWAGAPGAIGVARPSGGQRRAFQGLSAATGPTRPGRPNGPARFRWHTRLGCAHNANPASRCPWHGLAPAAGTARPGRADPTDRTTQSSRSGSPEPRLVLLPLVFRRHLSQTVVGCASSRAAWAEQLRACRCSDRPRPVDGPGALSPHHGRPGGHGPKR